jgi:HEAT repeat protein
MSKPLPPRPSLEHLRNEAKALLQSRRAEGAAEVSLQQVQHTLADEYGFRSWKELKDHVAEKAAVVAQADAALAVFTTKGPTHDSTGSEWSEKWHAEINRLQKAGETGFRVMEDLSRSPNGRARFAAAIFFWLSADARATPHLRRLMNDESVKVRERALCGYAEHIHPSLRGTHSRGKDVPAASLPDGIDAIFPAMSDANVKIRFNAVEALSAYARLHDERVEAALRKALDDPKHKVRHAAARALGIACPGCGNLPKPTKNVE